VDFLQQLVEWIPKAPLYGRFAFFAVGASVLAWYAFLYQPADVLNSKRKIDQKHAIAFLLGWDSMASLIPSTSKMVSIETVNGYMDQLGIKLDHSASYYLDDTSDGGARAQEFSQRTYGRLIATTDKQTANYFGFARNLVLSIGRNASTPALEADLKTSGIDLPPPLRKVPETDHLAWANRVYGYFAAKVYSAGDSSYPSD
jgi:hypothetical protein